MDHCASRCAWITVCRGWCLSVSSIFMVKKLGDAGHRKDDVIKAFLQAKCSKPGEEIRAFAPKGKTEEVSDTFGRRMN